LPEPTLELADIFRQHVCKATVHRYARTSGLAHGPAYRKAHSLPLHQHRLMQAIETCRTPMLGGVVEWCDHCHYTHTRYRSCLMESNFLWRVGRQKGMLRVASRPLNSPLRLGLQKREQFVRRAELALAKARRYNRFNGLELFGRISSNVDLRRGQIAVPQPQRDFPDVLRCL